MSVNYSAKTIYHLDPIAKFRSSSAENYLIKHLWYYSIFSIYGRPLACLWKLSRLVKRIIKSLCKDENENNLLLLAKNNARKQCSKHIPYYMFIVNKRNTTARCKICSKLAIKAPKRCEWRRSGVFIANFEHILHFFLVFLLLTLSM